MEETLLQAGSYGMGFDGNTISASIFTGQDIGGSCISQMEPGLPRIRTVTLKQVMLKTNGKELFYFK